MDEIKALSEDEVIKTLNLYRDDEVTPQLYDLGKLLIAQIDATAAAVDTKATWVLTVGVAMLGFLLTRIGPSRPVLEMVVYLVVGAFAAAACIAAFGALHSQRNWKGVSEKIWFARPKLVAGAEHVKRHYALAMHSVVHENAPICARKARILVRSQVFLAIAAFLLALTVGGAVIGEFSRAVDQQTSCTCSDRPSATPQTAGGLPPKSESPQSSASGSNP